MFGIAQLTAVLDRTQPAKIENIVASSFFLLSYNKASWDGKKKAVEQENLVKLYF